jgi:hypothetical protein
MATVLLLTGAAAVLPPLLPALMMLAALWRRTRVLLRSRLLYA